MDRQILSKIQSFLKKTLKTKNLKIEGRSNKTDSADVLIDNEFVGVVFEDKEDNETCYHFNMTILDFDLNNDD